MRACVQETSLLEIPYHLHQQSTIVFAKFLLKVLKEIPTLGQSHYFLFASSFFTDTHMSPWRDLYLHVCLFIELKVHTSFVSLDI